MRNVVKVPEPFSPKGRIIIRGYRAGAIDDIRPLAARLMTWRRRLAEAKDVFEQALLTKVVDRCSRQIEMILSEYALGIESATDNLIMTGALTGRDLLVQYLIGGTTYSGGLNYGAIGTGATTPAASDTQLTSEAARATPSIVNDIGNNQAQFQFYFPDANLANGTYREAGTFMNGTAVANSGSLFNHALLGAPFVKTSGVDTTLEVDVSLT